MECKYCKAILELKTIKNMSVGYCCKEWQVDEGSLKPKVRDSFRYKEKGSNSYPFLWAERNLC